MVKDVKLSPYDPSKGDIDCPDGQLQCVYETMPTNQGYGVSLSTRIFKRLPEGYIPLAVHHPSSGSQVLILARRIGGRDTLYHTMLSDERDIYTVEDMVEIAELSTVRQIECIGDTVVLCTDVGLVWLCWRNGSYLVIDGDIAMPEIDFGLQKAGSLICGDIIVCDTESVSPSLSSGIPGSGAYKTHLASSKRDDAVSIGSAISESLSRTISQQILSKGYFYQPFFIRYALRLSSGTYIAVSSPILMLPTVLPPAIGISATACPENLSYLQMDMTSIRYFSLRYRLRSAVPQSLAAIVQSIDVFISESIPTFDVDKVSSGYLSTLDHVYAATDDGGYNRGRRYPSRGDSDAVLFDGHYSISDDCYINHTVTPSADKVWYIYPNDHLHQDMLALKEYRLCCSLPVDCLLPDSSFRDLEIVSSDYSSLDVATTLDDASIAIQYAYMHGRASAIGRYGSQLVVALQSLRPASISSLSSFCAYFGSPGDVASDITVTVMLRQGTSTVSVTSVVRGYGLPLSEGFPHYLYYPDPNVYKMRFEQDHTVITLDMTRDPSGKGAYWWGGLEREPLLSGANAPADVAVSQPEAHVRMVCVSSPSDVLSAHSSLSLDLGAVVGFAYALSAPVGGSFGLYPLYVFSDEGVWLLRYDDSAAAFVAVRKVSADRCINPHGIVVAQGGVAYISGKEVKWINGSKITTLTDALTHLTFDITCLPHMQQLLDEFGLVQDRVEIDNLLSRCDLMCHHPSNSLILSSEDASLCLVYDIATHQWTAMDLHICHAVYGMDDVYVDCDGSMVTLSPSSAHKTALLLTRPLKLGTPLAPHDVTCLEVLGSFDPEQVNIVLYGSQDLRRWHLIGSAIGPVIDDVNTRPYRYLRAVILARLAEADYVYGLQIHTST